MMQYEIFLQARRTKLSCLSDLVSPDPHFLRLIARALSGVLSRVRAFCARDKYAIKSRNRVHYLVLRYAIYTSLSENSRRS